MGSITDWDSNVVIGKARGGGVGKATEREVNDARRSGGVVDSERKTGAGNSKSINSDHRSIAALDRKDDPTPPPTVSQDVGKAMMKARQDLGLTQKDLAQKGNEKPTIIQDYEQGKAIPNQQVLAKLEKILKVKLRGKDIGSPLLTPSEKKAAEAAGKKK